ncbi:MAG TPA: DUF2891 domain-containing protein [Gammaproteobacteria bacterium]|nr:DUF2891 domain-containing protein [Gammaproteobacteria bacterium]
MKFTFNETDAARMVRIVLDNVVREYPNHVMHMLNSDADALPPRVLHPAFYGSYDWHSAVHSHWTLVRALRRFPHAAFAAGIVAVLDRHLTVPNITSECRYFEAPNRTSYERPYGLAWLLQLAAELADWSNADALRWRDALRPLERLCAQRIRDWLPKLSHPIRGGEHSNSAFSLGLVFDWAQTVHDTGSLASIVEHSRRLYFADRDAPLAYEPSGHDFLSPALAEADLMRRVLSVAEFSAWLDRFMPRIPANDDATWLLPVAPSDPSDPKLAHLDGLNLSRAWMLHGIAASLNPSDPRRGALQNAAQRHADAGTAAINAERYEGSHWLPSFAMYLLTERGLRHE